MRYLLFLTCLMITACANTYNITHEPDVKKLSEFVTLRYADDNMVVYQYAKVQIDQVSGIASLYCETKDKKSAMLRDITLTKDFYHLATFNCVNLQK